MYTCVPAATAMDGVRGVVASQQGQAFRDQTVQVELPRKLVYAASMYGYTALKPGGQRRLGLPHEPRGGGETEAATRHTKHGTRKAPASRDE
jgi:hypothetical protein